MIKACLAWAFFCLVAVVPLRAFDWETATSDGHEYVTLRSFCAFYGFSYQAPMGNDRFSTRSAQHTLNIKLGVNDVYLDGVHYVMSFPIEGGDHDWLVSRMDVIKLFEPILRPGEISGRHSIRGVVIDPGHGGSDNGATSRYGAEKEYTLATAYMLEAILRQAGLKTVMTRRNDVFVDLYERAHIASLYPDYCFVSIHFNSATPEARGLETYCLSPRGAASTSSAYLTRADIQKLPGNDYDTQNVLLASMVHSEITRLNPGDSTADRGVKRARFVVIKQNVLPAILVEGGFVSNRMEAARVNRPDYRQALAQAIARGVVRFINAMGDDDVSLPGSHPDNNDNNDYYHAPAPPPKPIANVPPAPSGLANDPANGKVLTATPPPTHKKSKQKKTASAPATASTPASSGTGNSFNLAEPSPPPVSAAGSDQNAAEPDEPPTVSIYPTTSIKAPNNPTSAHAYATQDEASPTPTPVPGTQP
ncbi:MAG: N-acetylmuramoyl-L-alanine amidase [Methylacidiphilales bacterium]|nr:N-acetylmuramoyl-L-alanine amidase [Candidatus Methylacidiphilales bacterium]